MYLHHKAKACWWQVTASRVAVASQSAETWLHGCAELFWSWRNCTKGAAEAEKQSQHVLSDFQIQDMEMFTAGKFCKDCKNVKEGERM